jgi:hypothetical protein
MWCFARQVFARMLSSCFGDSPLPHDPRAESPGEARRSLMGMTAGSAFLHRWVSG